MLAAYYAYVIGWKDLPLEALHGNSKLSRTVAFAAESYPEEDADPKELAVIDDLKEELADYIPDYKPVFAHLVSSLSVGHPHIQLLTSPHHHDL